MIPGADGKSIVISDDAAADIAAFSRLVHNNDPVLKMAFSANGLHTLIRQAFGVVLTGKDIDAPPDVAAETLLAEVGEFLSTELGKDRHPRTFVFGCWLVKEQSPIDISFGPVRFESRANWLERQCAEGECSEIVRRRVIRRWSGARLRRLKNDRRDWHERAVIDAIGACPVVCSVRTNGLSADAAREKASLAAKLAMTGLALLWEFPRRAREGFGLLVDGGMIKQNHLVMHGGGGMTSSNLTGRRVGHTWVSKEEWARIWSENDWLVAPIADVMSALVNTTIAPARPEITKPIFHALWWLHEACCADVTLMQTVKFGACLDILAGAQSVGAILQLVQARIGAGPDDAITRDGRSARSVVTSIYSAARSQTIHGSNSKFNHDWTNERDLAEHLARRCFVEVLDWLKDNPQAKDLSGALNA